MALFLKSFAPTTFVCLLSILCFFLKDFLHLNILSIFFPLTFWGHFSSSFAYFTKHSTKGDCFYLWTAMHTLSPWHLLIFMAYSADCVLCSVSWLILEMFLNTVCLRGTHLVKAQKVMATSTDFRTSWNQPKTCLFLVRALYISFILNACHIVVPSSSSMTWW